MYYHRNGMPHHRFAVSVSKRIAKAVQRNYMKRRMKEIFRLHSQLVEKNFDLWVVMKKGFDRTQALEIENILINALIEINYQ